MIKNTVYPKPLESSFLSIEKDLQTVLNKLFIESQPYSDELKRLLVINTKDCLDKTNDDYKEIISRYSLPELRDKGYIKIEPRLNFGEHEEVKSYLLITFDDFTPSGNLKFRDCTITFDILSHPRCWDIGDYRLRPLKIAGIIDGILNNTRLSGIGLLQFAGCSELVLDETLSGYTLTYRAVHGYDDYIEEN